MWQTCHDVAKIDNHDQQRQRWKPAKGGPPDSPVCRPKLRMRSYVYIYIYIIYIYTHGVIPYSDGTYQSWDTFFQSFKMLRCVISKWEHDIFFATLRCKTGRAFADLADRPLRLGWKGLPPDVQKWDSWKLKTQHSQGKTWLALAAVFGVPVQHNPLVFRYLMHCSHLQTFVRRWQNRSICTVSDSNFTAERLQWWPVWHFFSSWVQNSLNRLSVIPLLAHYDPILNGYTMLYHYYPRNNPFLTHAYLICWAMSKFWRVPRAQLCRTLVIAARCTNMELILVISMCLDVHPRKVAAKSCDPVG